MVARFELVLALALSSYNLHHYLNVMFLQIITDFNIVKT